MPDRIQNILNTPDTYGRTGTHLAMVVAAQTVFISEEPPLYYDFYENGVLVDRIPIPEAERDAMRQASVRQNDQTEERAIARLRAEFALERAAADNGSLAGCALTPDAASAPVYQFEHLPVPENPPQGMGALLWIGAIFFFVSLALAIYARLP